ncbi:uncharacterized protein METZ01_LOCUS97202, partial [marine metagenome]
MDFIPREVHEFHQAEGVKPAKKPLAKRAQVARVGPDFR